MSHFCQWRPGWYAALNIHVLFFENYLCQIFLRCRHTGAALALKAAAPKVHDKISVYKPVKGEEFA